ncbi:MAG: nuclear transport factor 2 family protein [Betaproteobacteria bacterium]
MVPLLAALLFALAANADDLQDASKLFKAGQAQQALERVNRVLAQKPKDPQARFLKGVILTEQGNAKEAIEIFTRLTQDFPELPEPYNNLAVIYASQGQYDRARQALEQSIRTHPSYATAYENLGDVYAKLASQAYGKALQLDAGNTVAQNKLALVRDLVGGPPPGTRVAQAAPQKPAPAPEKPAPAAEKAAPAAEKPAAVAAAKQPAAATNGADEVLRAVNGWAQAWSKKDTDAYLAFYAKDFRVPGGESRAAWEKGRRTRIEAPKSIAVSVASPKVTMQGNDQATVSFRQTYRSDVFKGTSSKTLTMVKSDGRWLIRDEKSQ